MMTRCVLVLLVGVLLGAVLSPRAGAETGREVRALERIAKSLEAIERRCR